MVAFEAALEVLEQAAQKNPEDARIRSALGITFAGLGKKEEAVAAGRKAVEMYPVTKDALLATHRLMNLAQIYAMVGDFDPALEMIRKILSIPAIYTIHKFELQPSFDEVRNMVDYDSIRQEFDLHSTAHPPN